MSNKHWNLSQDFLNPIQNVVFIIFYRNSKAMFSDFFFLQALLSFLHEWENEFIINSPGTSTNPKCGLKWQMIGCFHRGLWELAAQAQERGPAPSAGASTASAQHQGCRLHWVHQKATSSTGSQPGQAVKLHGRRVHTLPCLYGNLVT